MKWLKKILGLTNNECADCGAPMQLSTLTFCQGRCNGVIVRFEKLPFYQCQNKTHQKGEPIFDFAQRIIEEIYINDQISWAELSTFEVQKCLSCKTKLDVANYETNEIAGDIIIDKLPKFKAYIQATVARCSACRIQQLVSDATPVEDVNSAIEAALREANIPAS